MSALFGVGFKNPEIRLTVLLFKTSLLTLIYICVQELVSKGKHNNWRNVAAFVAIGIVVLVLVIVGIVYLAGGSANDKQADAVTSARTLHIRSSISLRDVVDGKFSPKGFNGTWISGESEDMTNGISWQ